MVPCESVRALRGKIVHTHAKDERKVLSKIVAWYDREGGKVAGTVNRVAYASLDTKSGPSQMDVASWPERGLACFSRDSLVTSTPWMV